LFLRIRLFNDREIDEFLTTMPSSELNQIAELRQLIQQISGGYPVLLQNACYLIYNIWRSKEIPTIEFFLKEFFRATEHIFQSFWISCNEIEKLLLIGIAISRLQGHLKQLKGVGFSKFFSQRERELRNLEELGLIRLVEIQGTEIYQFTSSMMEFWVLREIESMDEERLSQGKFIQSLILVVQQSRNASESLIASLNVFADAFNRALGWQ
jgi:hypothetical protein